MDDTLWHQLPTTFDHVGTSDPRFFDRYWFAAHAPDGSATVHATMGAYRNMNVMDAAICVIHDGRQHNLRVSRSLGPEVDPVCGPIAIRPVEPLHEFRIVSGADSVRADVTWRSLAPPAEERPHFSRTRGRVTQDYRRFDQIGTATGRLEIGGKQLDLDHWWACRDHSWGVRPRIGIREPRTGPTTRLAEQGFAMAFLFFSTDAVTGHVQYQRRGSDPPYVTGEVRSRVTGTPRAVVEVDIAAELYDETRRFHECSLRTTLDDGEVLDLRCAALGAAVAMQGLGYSGGYTDGNGLGVWRGDQHLETEVWNVSDPAEIEYADGSRQAHWHRIQPVSVTADRTDRGHGSMTLILSGALRDFGLT